MTINIHETLRGDHSEIAIIQLKGYPYQQEINGARVDSTSTLEALARNSDYQVRLKENIAIAEENEHLTPLFQGGYYGIDAKIKTGEPLTFPEAYSLMTFVSMGVNRAVYDQLANRLPEGQPNDPDTIFYQSISLLSAMSTKEGLVGLSPEEIAGLTGATLQLDTIVRVPSSEPIIGLGGMGGDKGYPLNGENSKLFSLSTLAAIALSNFGPVQKHHSYPNTSKVAGQSAIENFGARSDQNSPEALTQLQEHGLLMTSCHTTRLIHTLSHRLKGETINHVVGPLSIPVSAETPLHAFIGVNHNVHPETIIQSLQILNREGIQTYTTSVAFCGLNNADTNDQRYYHPDQYYKNPELKTHIAIDEVAPPPHCTLASFLVDGKNMGTFLITPEDFMDPELITQAHFDNLLIHNTKEAITSANNDAINGQDLSKTAYLAMTVALGLFTREYAHLPNALDPQTKRVNSVMLKQAFTRAFTVLANGESRARLDEYVTLTQQLV